MNAKQILLLLLVGFPAVATAAPQSDRESAGHERAAERERAAQIIIRSDAEKKRRKALRGDDNENSNRQSDPDSTRGLERAEERRAEPAEEHAQAGKDEGWYEYLFGRPAKKDKAKDQDDDDSWWWPFD